MIPIQIKIAIVAVVIASTFAAGWSVNGWRIESQIKAANDAAESARIEKADAASKIAQENASHEQKVQIVYRDRIKTIYRSAGPAKCIDDAGLRFREQWNEIAGYAFKPDAAVPASAVGAKTD